MSVLLFSSRTPWPEGRSPYPGPLVVRQPSDPDLEALRSAEDAVQETWLTCLRTFDRFEARSSLKTWIFGILVNVVRARRRKESRIQPFTSLLRRVAGEGRGPTVDPQRFDGHGA